MLHLSGNVCGAPPFTRTRAVPSSEPWIAGANRIATAGGVIPATDPPKQLAEIPYFWSDQYGTKIQALGEPSGTADLTLLMAGAAGDRPLYLYSRGKQLTGVLGFGLPRAVMRMRSLLTEW